MAYDAAAARRRLIRLGVLLFLLSMIEGMFVQQMQNPRMGVSTHVGGAMSGIFVALIGVAWCELRLGPRLAAATLWLTLFGFYVGTLGLLLAAVLGTGRSTPQAGAGYLASPAREQLVSVVLQAGGVAVLLACGLALWGLRGRGRDLGAGSGSLRP